MISALKNIWNIPDLRRRVMFTFAMLAVYRIGGHIPTPGINAQDLAMTIEDTIRKREDFKAKSKTYAPSYVAIGVDMRTNSLIVAGSRAQFQQVQKLVEDLEQIQPASPASVRVINLKNIKAGDLKKVLDQMMEDRNQQQSQRRRR